MGLFGDRLKSGKVAKVLNSASISACFRRKWPRYLLTPSEICYLLPLPVLRAEPNSQFTEPDDATARLDYKHHQSRRCPRRKLTFFAISLAAADCIRAGWPRSRFRTKLLRRMRQSGRCLTTRRLSFHTCIAAGMKSAHRVESPNNAGYLF